MYLPSVGAVARVPRRPRRPLSRASSTLRPGHRYGGRWSLVGGSVIGTVRDEMDITRPG